MALAMSPCCGPDEGALGRAGRPEVLQRTHLAAVAYELRRAGGRERRGDRLGELAEQAGGLVRGRGRVKGRGTGTGTGTDTGTGTGTGGGTGTGTGTG